MANWQVGDLAVCVDVSARGQPLPPRLLVVGRAYRVCAVTAAESWCDGDYDAGLVLEGLRSPAYDGSYRASRFRKIRPDEHEACEPEFVTLLKRVKVRA